MNRKLAAALAVLLACLALFALLRRGEPVPAVAPREDALAALPQEPTTAPPATGVSETARVAPTDRVEVPARDRPEARPELLITVFDTAGLPLVGVCVRVQRTGGLEAGGGVTTAEGPCRVPLDELGTYAIDTTVGNRLVQVEERRSYAVDIVAAELTTVSGRVVDADGAGAPGASIRIATDDSCLGLQPVATSAADGSFQLRVGKAWCFLSASKPGHVDGPIEQAKDGVTLTLGTASSRCLLRTVDPNGAPVDCLVLAGRPFAIRLHVPTSTGELQQQRWPPGREHRTGERGEVELEGIGAFQRDLTVVPLDPRWGRWQGTWQGLDSQTVALEPANTVEGRVLDGTGAGVAGVLVRVGDSRQWRPPVALSDGEGRFSLRGVGTGRQQVRAAADAGSADAHLDCAGGARSFVTLVLGGKNRVRLVDADGRPRAGVVVKLSSAADSALSVTDDDGRVTAPQSWWRDLVVEVLAADGAWRATDAAASGPSLLTVRERGPR
ncbi:MAG: hypothetical protein H6838_16120 [Planctomycetes bacterium]|nr:hypothetical protein [Planctomycetota bacterium]MCB9887019.1 hypothetical protein [Planctomycetota bacterium]